MQSARSKKAEKREETRASLIAMARRSFANRGYTATGTEEIVAEAGVTRGALYFHFADKADLFAAVFDQVAREIAGEISGAAETDAEPLGQLRRGAAAYVDACCEASRRQIYLVDGPSVLGAERWHREETRYAGPLLEEGVAAAIAETAAPFDAAALTCLLDGALLAAARRLAFADDAEAQRPPLLAAFDEMTARLFGSPG